MSKLDLQSDDELNQIKSSCNKLINQYEEAFNLYTGSSSDKNKIRQLYYTGELTVAELLEKHSDLKLGDIKYDIKSKFAEEV